MADYASVLTGGTNSFPTTSEHLNALATDILSDGIIGTVANTAGVAPATGGLACNAQGTPNMTVAVTAGVAYVTATPTSQASQRIRANIAAQNATIAANSTGGTRYDWIYVKITASTAANPAADGSDVASIVVSRSTSSSVDNGTPPTYGYHIATVTVSNGASSITNGNISDTRSSIQVTNNSASDGWTSLGVTPDTITNNGNRSYDLVFNTNDLTDTISKGMRLKLTRGSTAPTLCTDLESSSSQYYSKTSPNKLTFTDDFTCMGWVKLESYTAGGIIARRNGDTEGWSLSVNANGTVHMDALRIAGNNASVSSYQSIPLGRWVHVAATYDLSGTDAHIYFDGVEVASLKTVTGTCTALVQGTTALVVGATKSAGTEPFDGKIAQAAVFSAVLSAATIRSYMSQGLLGTETSLASGYSFNNSIADLNTTTPNDLTAQNSAAATSSDSPFAGGDVSEFTDGTIEMGIVVKTAFSTNTTLTVQVPESYAIPTSGGITAISYSSQKVPYGFPCQSNRWRVVSLFKGGLTTQATPVQNTWYNLASFYLTVPTGENIVGYESCIQANEAGTSVDIQSTLSTGSSTETDVDYTAYVAAGAGSGTIAASTFVKRDKGVVTTTGTPYYHNVRTTLSGIDNIYIRGDNMMSKIYADCAFV